ncbi:MULTISPECIES: energy transducer TonB [Gammaproteobacteria]|uniref:energy transducer TonB n=1 Tax=Gammaproteobacteria TaxID=1236 RepID=UPI000DCFE7B8|nr:MULTISPECIES: energy transducer TonB [Gammaproteobacteria]RTE86594.1 energy transducer TonB [Aliidiomarina sp. B3213]TCZ90851.1 energy transducer TonB [Lysobacter sp. N42]
MTRKFILIMAAAGLLAGCAASDNSVSNSESVDTHRTLATTPEQTQPLVRVAPRFPVEAARRRLEGYVSLQLTVDNEGRPQNITVVDSEPEGVFEREVIKAVEQWRYVPADNVEIMIRLDMRLVQE